MTIPIFLQELEKISKNKPEVLTEEVLQTCEYYIRYSTDDNRDILIATINTSTVKKHYKNFIDNLNNYHKSKIKEATMEELGAFLETIRKSYKRNIIIRDTIQELQNELEKKDFSDDEKWYLKTLSSQAKEMAEANGYSVDTLYDIAVLLLSPAVEENNNLPPRFATDVDLEDIYEGRCTYHLSTEYKSQILAASLKCYEYCYNHRAESKDKKTLHWIFDLAWTKFYFNKENKTLTTDVIAEVNRLLEEYQEKEGKEARNEILDHYPKFIEELQNPTKLLCKSTNEDTLALHNEPKVKPTNTEKGSENRNIFYFMEAFREKQAIAVKEQEKTDKENKEKLSPIQKLKSIPLQSHNPRKRKLKNSNLNSKRKRNIKQSGSNSLFSIINQLISWNDIIDALSKRIGEENLIEIRNLYTMLKATSETGEEAYLFKQNVIQLLANHHNKNDILEISENSLSQFKAFLNESDNRICVIGEAMIKAIKKPKASTSQLFTPSSSIEAVKESNSKHTKSLV